VRQLRREEVGLRGKAPRRPNHSDLQSGERTGPVKTISSTRTSTDVRSRAKGIPGGEGGKLGNDGRKGGGERRGMTAGAGPRQN